MSNPAIITFGANSPLQVGGSTALLAALSGSLTQFKNANWTPQNLTGCAVNSDGSVRKTATTSAWDAGCTSVETIALGDEAFWFVANLPANEIASPFGGRQFFAGLTAKNTVTTYTDIEFGIQVFEGGVGIWENGVLKRLARASRNNGIYQVGIESGQIVYRADGEILFRSTQSFAYPLRVGVAFFNGNGFDRIGGNTNTTFTYSAFDKDNASAGNFTSFAGITTWHAPNVKGRYKLRVNNQLNVNAYATVDVLAQMPWGAADGLPCPSVWYQQPEEYVTKETLFDDQGGDYNTPYNEPIRRWKIEYTNKLNVTQAAILDNFWRAHKGWSEPFYFFDERAGILYDNVRFVKDGYTRTHQKIWLQTRSIQLIRRPL